MVYHRVSEVRITMLAIYCSVEGPERYFPYLLGIESEIRRRYAQATKRREGDCSFYKEIITPRHIRTRSQSAHEQLRHDILRGKIDEVFAPSPARWFRRIRKRNSFRAFCEQRGVRVPLVENIERVVLGSLGYYLAAKRVQ